MTRSSSRSQVLIDAILWNQPALTASSDPGAKLFCDMMALRLTPEVGSAEIAVPGRSTLEEASYCLAHELVGDIDAARAGYTQLSGRPGLPGLLGMLLLAWQDRSSVEIFRQVDMRARRMRSIDRTTKASIYAKLMTWALERGHRDLSIEYYDKALELSSGEMQAVLGSIGSWFERPTIFRQGQRVTDDLVRYPWTSSLVDDSATRALERGVERRGESVWVHRWEFGGPEGVAIQAAELQASWAGAFWLLPEIYRVHSALLLSSENPGRADVEKALILRLLGGAPKPGALLDSCEFAFDAESVRHILVDGLRSGSRLHRPRLWVDACAVFWDQLPDDLVVNLCKNLTLPVEYVAPGDEEAVAVSLFAVLYLREKSAWLERFEVAADRSVELILRSTSPTVVSQMSATVARRALDVLLSGPGERGTWSDIWESYGWDSAAMALRQLPKIDRKERTRSYLRLLPDRSVPSVLRVAPELIPTAVVDRILGDYVGLVGGDLERAKGGSMLGRNFDPRADLAELAIHGSGAIVDRAIDALLEAATSRFSPRSHQFASLRALLRVVKHGLATHADVSSAIGVAEPPYDSRIAHFGEDYSDELMSVARLALAVASSGPDAGAVAQLLIASRDQEARVRQIATNTIADANELNALPGLDTALFGAAFDSDEVVQNLAWNAYFSNAIHDPNLRLSLSMYLTRSWESRPRAVRIAAARALGSSSPQVSPDHLGRLGELAANDRSWTVRNAFAAGPAISPVWDG